MKRILGLLAGCLIVLSGCDDVTAIELTGASYRDGVLGVGMVPKHGEAPVQPSGRAHIDVLDGTAVRCSSEPLHFDTSSYRGPLLQLESRVECATEGEGLQVRVRFTPEGADEVVATGGLIVHAPDPSAAVAAAAPVAASRPPDSPCGRTERAPAATSDARFTYGYGPLTECTGTTVFGVVGCPTTEHHRLGTGTFDHVKTFRYDARGRLVRVEQQHPSSAGPDVSFDVSYDAEGSVARIVEHIAEGPDTTRLYSREGNVITERGGPVSVTYQLDERGRVVSTERRSSMIGVLRSTWRWEGERVVEVQTTNEEGGVVATSTYGYDC